ncbi:oligopeptide ABC transporter permease OppB [Reinekea marinisedimentorum]|uniref:Oligopeptide transport system permease protein n=1 Tax=Reinekea marinisedimentorum TaxID=230495 RepID=A0A4R3I8W9_9GAMM|nr:oligopeptide ABC transporter permease OppB [Reinekea marinisedimentorum]TCS41759.1 oligopeptide transport system permease protein [Reinekea marinisedimentorum]
MFSFIAKRLLTAIPTLLILIVVSFLLMHSAPGGPFTSERKLPPQVEANINAKYGLDKPLPTQIFNYVKGIVVDFDFGPSFRYKDRSVNDLIEDGFPVTITYGLISALVAVLVGVSLGVVAALNQNTWKDYTALSFTFTAQVLPNFVMAPLLVLLFTLKLGWLPGGGWEGGKPQYIIMPVIALSTSYMATIARITRSSMLEVLNSNFIRTAKAKGLPHNRIIFKHALKPAMLPVLSYLGPAMVGLLTGSVVIDMYFSTGGIGVLFVNGALNRDYSTIMGITILVGVLTVLLNLLVDVLYAWIDPKIRY